MRKLTTVTAAAALVAAMIALPTASAIANEVEVVILKCGESIDFESRGLEKIIPSADDSAVVQISATLPKPAMCSLGSACAPCLKALINDHGCKAGTGTVFPRVPLVVGTAVSRFTNIGGVIDTLFSVEKYVFQCEED